MNYGYIMNLLNPFSRSTSARLVEPLGTSIAERCYPQLVKLVSSTILTMTLAEARGYTRAVLGPAIRSLVGDVVNCTELDRRLHLPLVERVLDLTHSQILAERNIAVPATISLPLKRVA